MAYCQHCGAQLSAENAVCGKCGCKNKIIAQAPELSDSSIARMALPVGRTPLSIVAGYLGLLSLTFILAPVSLIVGLLAIRDLKAHPDMHGLGRAWFGTIMGGIFTAMAIIGLVARYIG
ncbi:MAG: zinc ribbon domain-containing protein [Planctomycetes bacterium]|nr:zinc ribbon domain-containing protein [Planctomycetota bacterium]